MLSSVNKIIFLKKAIKLYFTQGFIILEAMEVWLIQL